MIPIRSVGTCAHAPKPHPVIAGLTRNPRHPEHVVDDIVGSRGGRGKRVGTGAHPTPGAFGYGPERRVLYLVI